MICLGESNYNENISFSWKLLSENKDDSVYIEILKAHRTYGFPTMTKLVAAALKEYSDNHNHKKESDEYRAI